MADCPQCQAGRRAGRKFCLGCGAPLTAPPSPVQRRCEACGADHPPDKKFCPACGRPLSGPAEGPARQAADTRPPTTRVPDPAAPAPPVAKSPPAAPQPPPQVQAPAPASREPSPGSRSWLRIGLPVALVILAVYLIVFAITVFSTDGFTDLKDDEVLISWGLLIGGIAALVLARAVFVRGRRRAQPRADL